MKIFLIGDVQGCYRELQALLDKMAPGQGDAIWFCGDLVGRGPQALEVMRLAYELPGVQMVLGNHDLHLLAIAAGVRADKPSLRLSSLLASKEIGDYVEWLRSQPLVLTHRDIMLVHACLHPQWTESRTLALSAQVQKALQSPQYPRLLRDMYGDFPAKWDDSLRGPARHRTLLNIFTRARYFHKNHQLNLDRDDSPSNARLGDDDIPWYELKHRRDPQTLVFFGHWSALADYNIAHEYGVYHLDKGCVWGNRLFGVELFWSDGPEQKRRQARSTLPAHSFRQIREHTIKAGQGRG